MKTFNIHHLVRPNVVGLKPYASARDEFDAAGKQMVFLDANENPFSSDVNRYPDPQQRRLKEVLARQRRVAPEKMLLGNGSDEVLDLLFRAFCEPGRDNIITLPPTYGMYGVLASINNIGNREMLLSTTFQPRVPEILRQVDQHTKMIFLCSPNNPSGNSFSPESIRDLLEEFPGLVVIDEAYIDFSEKQSWIGSLEEYPNLVVTQTFSKAWGMAGIRLGICYASPQIIQLLHKIKPPYNVNELTQQRALKALDHAQETMEQVKELLEQRNWLLKELSGVALVKEVFPSDANFILVRVDCAEQRYQELLELGIVTRNRSSQPLCEECLRLTVGTPEENQQLMEALRNLQLI